MRSHDYARKLQELAQLMLFREAFELGHPKINLFFYDDKAGFLKAARALGTGEKVYEGDSFIFVVKDILKLYVNRDQVCKLVSPAQYECVPLLSQDEKESLV